jgi:putative ABC transport system permease protein
MLYELLQLAVGNLGRARGRLMMTAGGVVVGTTAVIILIGLTLGLQETAEASIGSDASITQIDVYTSWNPDPQVTLPKLNSEAVNAFWQIPGVAVVIPTMRLQGGELSSGDYRGWGDIQGIDPRLLPYMQLRTTTGEVPILAPGQVLAGTYVGTNFYDPTSEEYTPIELDLLTERVRLEVQNSDWTSSRRVDLNVAALLSESGTQSDYAIYMPIDEVIALNEWATGNKIEAKDLVYDQVVVRATSRETTTDVMNAIRDMGFGAGGMGEYLNSLNGFFTTLRLMLGGVGSIALLVAAFGVANTMMMAIMERTREIGIMKAIGATNQEILMLFLIEAGLVGFSGGVVGIGISQLIKNGINTAIQQSPQDNSGFNFLPLDPSQLGGNLVIVPPELMVFALILATLIGAAAGAYPAWRAARMAPVIALKQE